MRLHIIFLTVTVGLILEPFARFVNVFLRIIVYIEAVSGWNYHCVIPSWLTLRPRHFGSTEDVKPNEEWRLTPSIMDANSFSFTSFANQPSGYYTPATGGTSTFYHNKAGDLHTPNLGFHLGTPLSLPHSEGRHDTTTVFDMQGFQPNFLECHGYQASNHFAHQQTFAPSSFLHQNSAFDTMDGSVVNTPVQQTIPGNLMNQQTNVLALSSKTLSPTIPNSIFPSSNKSVFLCMSLIALR